MKCGSSQRYILLAASGELSERKARALRAHLACCRPCGEYEVEVSRVVQIATRALSSGEPSELSMRRVLEAGAAGNKRTCIVSPFPLWKIAACAAAAALILVGAAIRSISTGARSDANNTIAEISDIVAICSEAQDNTQPQAVGDAPRDKLRELARQLLILEGLEPANLMLEDQPAQADDSQPKGLQSRRMRASPPAGCV